MKKLKILSLNSGHRFAEQICDHLNNIAKSDNSYETKENELYSLVKGEEVTFANGELKYVIHENIRDNDVYVVQLIDDPESQKTVNDNLIALSCALNAAYYSDAARVNAVIPQFPYARQDKRKGRENISARMVGQLLEQAGAKRVITLDLHSETIEGFFSGLKLENLHMGGIFIEYVKKNMPQDNFMIVSPDVGSAKRGGFFARELGVNLAIINKERNYAMPSAISEMRLVGKVYGKNVLITDDMISTGNTLLSALELLKNEGAEKIYIAVPLSYFSGHAIAAFDKAYEKGLFEEVISSNAVQWGRKLKDKSWYTELDISKLFAHVIYNLHMGKSVSRLLSTGFAR